MSALFVYLHYRLKQSLFSVRHYSRQVTILTFLVNQFILSLHILKFCKQVHIPTDSFCINI